MTTARMGGAAVRRDNGPVHRMYTGQQAVCGQRLSHYYAVVDLADVAPEALCTECWPPRFRQVRP